MADTVAEFGLTIDRGLYAFINDEVLAGLGIDSNHFWRGFAEAVAELTPINRALLEKRQTLQHAIDAWLCEHRGKPLDMGAYKSFLHEIGYLTEEGADFTITTPQCDVEITSVAGPQLVVPVLNARYALNAANARWGSLYDALYGTDAIPHDDTPPTQAYDPKRGAEVIAFVRKHLDQFFPLACGSHAQAKRYWVEAGALQIETDTGTSRLANPNQFKAWQGEADNPNCILLAINGLHLELVLDRTGAIGKDDAAGIDAVMVESALSTIVDLEDSVAAVDAMDKTHAYRNWLGLMKGTLTTQFNKGGKVIARRLNPDRTYTAADGGVLTLPGRALLLARNVGHLMTNPAITDAKGEEVFEGLMDAFITATIALYDLRGLGVHRNSRQNAIYIVKPKQHGPEEMAFTDTLFSCVESLLQLAPNTIKVGIMDEERRTSANLKECIRALKNRVFFINTGFLDRTGDEIHTSMEAGAMVKKADMKATPWIKAYEDWNVDVGLFCGFSGKAQIGKGMWAMPDLMAHMMEQKITHPLAGANTAWVPSPTAASLHALHYHAVDVFAVQKSLMGQRRARLDDLLTIPTSPQTNWSEADIEAELNNNAQSILGYVVRWVDQGVGCSKVPDINNIGLMEDRATLRISAQHIANWLHHGIVSRAQVIESLEAMAQVVDKQNADDEAYQPMAADFANSIAFQAACELVLEGAKQPSGYTEPILHRRRLQAKRTQDTSR